MKRVVISVGGSVIVPDNVDTAFLRQLATLVNRRKDYQFILVTGGGSTARKYIKAARALGNNEYLQSLVAMAAIYLNARLLASVLGIKDELPKNMQEAKKNIRKKRIVVLGTLGYEKKVTSDSLAAHLAKMLRAPFINVTNVNGLYTEDPKKTKNAKLIRSIRSEDFFRIANAMKFQLGQHFVLDQHAASIVKRYRIPTFIIGKNMRNLGKLLDKKPFTGTSILP